MPSPSPFRPRAAHSRAAHLAIVGLLIGGILLPTQADPQQPHPRTDAAAAGYFQFPALHGSTLIFSSESDLWSVPVTGGAARRLTSHPAPESEPHLSPDGRWLAFTGRYDGGADVYRMPAGGGPSERLTHESDEVRVRGWTPDGRILYASQGTVGPSWFWVLRTVDPESGRIDDIPLADAREGSFDDAGTLYFTRFGIEVTADNVRSYRGGAMARLWRFRPGTDAEAERLAPDHAGNLTRPMWWNGHLYVVSDADGVANLWRLDSDGGNATQLTGHADFEVRSATLASDGGRIVYQHGADLRVFDIAAGTDRRVSINLGSDRARARTRWINDPMNWLNSVGFGPRGDRVALTARGRLVVVGTGDLRRMELPLPAASRAREAVPSPDGEWIFAFVDAGGEQEIWRLPADGSGSGEALTSDAAGHRVGMRVSPDGSRIAHWDRGGRLWLLDVASGANPLIDESRAGGYADVVWSPDGRALAVSRAGTPMRRPQILLLDLDGRTAHTLTTDRYESFSPAFSPDGRWLWFLSNRTFTPTPGSPWGDRNTGPVFDQRTRLYALALQSGNAFPLAPRTELTAASGADGGRAGGGARSGPGDGNTPAGANGSGGGSELPAIEYAGLADRLFEAPIPSGNYAGLQATGSRLYLIERAPGSGPVLRTIDLGAARPRLTTFGEGITSAVLSGDRSRMLVRRGSELFIVPTGAQLPSDLTDARVRAGSWRVAIEPAEEWRQMFVDAWRMQRDFLYDPELRGVDWEAVRDRYAPLVERVGDRRELDDVLRQMVAELGVLHSQVRGGEYPSDPETAAPSFLGATFEPAPGGLRVTHIYRTDPELPSERAPLARPGVDLRAGDLITRVNGRPVTGEGELTRLLAHQSGEQVRVDYERAGAEGSVVVHPVNAARDSFLRYADWVNGRREAVEAATDGRVGYLHLRAMGAGDMADFVREFFANLDRDGLIIDVRRNRGGNIDSWVIERLLRRGWSFWSSPGQDPQWNMQQSFRGHLVVLIDPLTYSDGETFAAGVKALGLGPLVGVRTAGAGVWLSDTNRLIDQGLMRAAQMPQFDADGAWIVEGFGVEPDIHVENLPRATFQGRDAQLERAIEEVLRALEADPVTRPDAGRMAPFPTPVGDVRPGRRRPGGG